VPPTTVQPTTVQPGQQSGHQATQVSPAATAAQQRPANGGAPAPAGAKQAANGKEDDEDWWTE
jgi:hypothetical protein